MNPLDSAIPETRIERTWRGAFIGALRECGTVYHAAKAVGIDRNTAYNLRNADPTFAREWDAALDDFADTLEQEAVRRARGIRELVIHQGKPCGVWVNDAGEIVSETTPGAKLVPLTESRYSDGLLMFTLKGYKRAKYAPAPDQQPEQSAEQVKIVEGVDPNRV
jgi:hypothetical protein